MSSQRYPHRIYSTSRCRYACHHPVSRFVVCRKLAGSKIHTLGNRSNTQIQAGIKIITYSGRGDKGAADVFLENERKNLSYVQSEERHRAMELYFTTPMTTAQMVRHLGYPTRQCLERWLAADPRYAGHMCVPASWRHSMVTIFQQHRRRVPTETASSEPAALSLLAIWS